MLRQTDHPLGLSAHCSDENCSQHSPTAMAEGSNFHSTLPSIHPSARDTHVMELAHRSDHIRGAFGIRAVPCSAHRFKDHQRLLQWLCRRGKCLPGGFPNPAPPNDDICKCTNICTVTPAPNGLPFLKCHHRILTCALKQTGYHFYRFFSSDCIQAVLTSAAAGFERRMLATKQGPLFLNSARSRRVHATPAATSGR